MTHDRWQELGSIPLTRLEPARHQCHWALQIVSATADAMLAHRADDSHSNVEWVSHLGALVGHALAGDLRLGLQLSQLGLVMVRGDEVIASQALDGLSMAQAMAWVGDTLGQRLGRDMERPIELRDYDMPDHPVAKGAAFAALEHEQAELARWFDNADRLLRALQGASLDRVSTVACWPHHFDIALLISLDPASADPETARSIGIGLSPGDEPIPEPYWYVGAWPRPDADKRPQLSAEHGGVWMSFGAVLRGSQIVAAGTSHSQQARVEAFVDETVRVSRELLESSR